MTVYKKLHITFIKLEWSESANHNGRKSVVISAEINPNLSISIAYSLKFPYGFPQTAHTTKSSASTTKPICITHQTSWLTGKGLPDISPLFFFLFILLGNHLNPFSYQWQPMSGSSSSEFAPLGPGEIGFSGAERYGLPPNFCWLISFAAILLPLPYQLRSHVCTSAPA